MKETNTLQEIAEVFHVPASTLQYWDAKKVIQEDNNYRLPTITTLMDICKLYYIEIFLFQLKK